MLGINSISSQFKFRGATPVATLRKISYSGCYYKNFVITPAPTYTNRFVQGNLYRLRYLVLRSHVYMPMERYRSSWTSCLCF